MTQTTGPSDGDDGRREPPINALRTFQSYPLPVHLAVIGALLALWVVVFLALTEGVVADVLWSGEGLESRSTRRLAGGAAAFVVGVGFGLATAKRLGGPVVNFLLSGFAPLLGALVLIARVTGPVGGFYAPVPERFALSGLIATLPGTIAFVLTITLYSKFVMSEADKKRWAEAIPPNPVVKPQGQHSDDSDY